MRFLLQLQKNARTASVALDGTINERHKSFFENKWGSKKYCQQSQCFKCNNEILEIWRRSGKSQTEALHLLISPYYKYLYLSFLVYFKFSKFCWYVLL